MEQNTFLHSLVSPMPPYSRSQEELVAWTLKAHQRAQSLVQGEALNERLLQRFCLNSSHIKNRYFELSDVDEEWSKHSVYHLMPESINGSDILKRNEVYNQAASRVISELYQEDKDVPEHLIHVSCTGYVSPSPAQSYFSSRTKVPDITHAYHMGCYAALPSVRIGAALIKGGDCADVDIVHTEMCSLHLDPHCHTPEQMVVQSLFADGHIKYKLTQRPKGRSFRVKSILEKLVPNSGADMTWIPGPYGMKMGLSKEVPDKIRMALPNFIQEICLKAKIDWPELQQEGIFAIHPGGPKIIESAQMMMDLRDDQVELSKKVLKARGNMSSATLPHVWKEMLEANSYSGKHVLSLAFGPGLTIFGAIFEMVEE